ncbi:ammonia-dependent NAD(+) synthetase [Streptomyces sp. BG9H]|uniref:NH(3)-dependent NAD(+) synthetase n=1 Tax=Streptomyces anatolicus TaxID=2675858 RepID=A0ABS6YQF2_9ACTN|nr:ammonia-dependent NAD(+) synthetase [Streptomyces anatolicus]MBW5423614.1 ammonia-dependent NAD(+) synthetase [Streptomyces anatolicus]
MTDRASLTVQQEIARALQVSEEFDVRQEVERRVAFLADQLTSNGLRSLVLGISGGVDSTTAGRLCQLAVERVRAATGREAVFFAMRLPYGTQADEKDARSALEFIRPDKVLTVDVKPAADAALAAVAAGGALFRDAHHQDFVLGNIKARQRMIAQYAVAGAHEGLVVGTDQAAEAASGFFTKFGDGAADVVPLTGLTKRRVRALAQELGAPPALVQKVPTADLESLNPGLSDEEALGVTYEEIDDFLEGKPVADAARNAIVERYHRTAHKRELPIGP